MPIQTDDIEPVRIPYRGNRREFSVMGDSILRLLKDCRLSTRNKASQYPQLIIRPIPAVYSADHLKRITKLYPLRWDCCIDDELTIHIKTEDGDGVRSTFRIKPIRMENFKVVAIWDTEPGFDGQTAVVASHAPEPETLAPETAVPVKVDSQPKRRKNVRVSPKIEPIKPPTWFERFVNLFRKPKTA